jgi:pyruvate kinase
MTRQTKIVATLGPATTDADSLQAIVEAGVDLVRMNLSHGNHDEAV